MHRPTKKPTLHFIGLRTAGSSIMRIFPMWAVYLGLGDCQIQGMDFALDAPPEAYTTAVKFIKEDPLSRGALVTTHKLNLFAASKDHFDQLTPGAALLQEVSCISKRKGNLIGEAVDLQTAVMALEGIVGPHYWEDTKAALICLGAGGANLALTTALLQQKTNAPSLIRITDVNPKRLSEMQRIHQQIDFPGIIEYVLVKTAKDSDQVVSAAPTGSVIINGTGMGKDLPGSPISEQAIFPTNSYAWDFNYRGRRLFLEQAKAQQKSRKVMIADGWRYFIKGWSRVIGEVFQVDIPSSGPVFDDLSAIAAKFR